MSCAFCITGTQSQDSRTGVLEQHLVPAEAVALLPQLRSITIEGGEPSIHLAAALELIADLPDEIPLVWKTNAYASAEAMEMLTGIPDVVLADYKFGSDACAMRLARVPDYGATVHRNLRWAYATSCLVVRHLLMPGHVECCFRPVARWLAEEMPGVEVSLMTGYLPKFRANQHPEINRTNRRDELERAQEIARELGLNLAPWHVAPPGEAPASEAHLTDEVWIDSTGRICVGFASAALVQCLDRLAPELGIHPEGS